MTDAEGALLGIVGSLSFAPRYGTTSAVWRLTSRPRSCPATSWTMPPTATGSGLMQDGQLIAVGSPAELRAPTGVEDASLEDAFLYAVRRRAYR